MRFKLLFLTLVAVVVVVPAFARADVVSDLRAQINGLLQQIAALQLQIVQLGGGTTTGGTAVVTPTTSSVSCPVFSRDLTRGSRGTDVSVLQQFLSTQGFYNYPAITGYYGEVTERAVQSWQQAHYVVMGGSAAINGFGVVGAKTRAAIHESCATTPTNPVVTPPTTGTTPPATCQVWNDGCNSCSRTSVGGPLACTMRACFAAGTPYCEAYFPNVGTGLTIHSFSGPTTLQIRETGTWTINASDPANGRLSYKVDWGEQQALGVLSSIASLLQDPFVQTTTFTHSYSTAGVYTVTVTVRNASTGVEARTSTTVRVSNSALSTGVLYATQTSGEAPMGTIFRANVGGFSSYRYELDFGDGSARVAMSCYAPLDYCMSPATAQHTYTTRGTYLATLYKIARDNTSSTVEDSLTITVGGGSAAQCRSNGILYPEGTQRTCIRPDGAASEQCIADAYYVCENGSWNIDGGSLGTVCTLEYAPVCGSLRGTQQTYGNSCQLNAAGATRVHDGVCATAGEYSVSTEVPDAGAYVRGGSIPVYWTTSTNAQSSVVNMYLSLEDVVDGSVVKSVKVNPRDGYTTIHTGDTCNEFFSDGLDAQCSSFMSNVAKGHTRYRIRAALYTPVNACFGFCTAGSPSATILSEALSNVFTIR